MRKIIIIPLIIIACLSLYTTVFIYKTPSFVYNSISNYAVTNLEATFGAQKLAPQFEEKIKQIAFKMGITEEIHLRKMNYIGLQTFGYYNALYMTPQFFGLLPILDKPYIYISQGFLENLTDDEQLFLIGHELGHLKERHVSYLPLIQLLVNICILALWWYVILGYIEQIIMKREWSIRLKKHTINLLGSVIIALCIALSSISILAYYRHIEWQADEISLSCLHSHDGALKLMERWEKEYKIPSEQGYRDIFSNHPSTKYRIQYCIEHKQLHHEDRP
jgi:Zn-dependent protease with chaperone function